MHRYDCVDLTKVILAFFVVGIHVKIFNESLLPLFRLAVPMFFIFSSYFFFSKDKPNLRKTIGRICKLYGFWFVLLFPITMLVRQYYKEGLLQGVLSIIKDVFFESTFLASWYLSALAIGLIVVFLVLKSKYASILLPTLMLFCFILSILASNYYFLIENSIFSTFLRYWLAMFGAPCNSFIIAIFWIGVGYYIQKIKVNVRLSLIALLSFVSILLIFLEANLIKNLNVSILTDEVYISLIPAAIFNSLLVLNVNIAINNGQLIRRFSTFLYCLHFSVAIVINKLVSYFNIYNKYNLTTYALTIISCLIVFCLFNYLKKYRLFNFLKYSM